MKDFVAPLGRWTETRSTIRRRLSMPQGQSKTEHARLATPARKSSDSPRGDSATPHYWWTGQEPKIKYAVQIHAPCLLVYDYLSAPSREAHDAVLQEFVDRTLFAKLPKESGLRRLTEWFSSLPIAERGHPHEQGKTRTARICLNLAYLLVPYGNLNDADVSARWAGQVALRDERLRSVWRELLCARQRMRMLCPRESLLHFEAALQLVSQMHREGEEHFRPFVTGRMSETYRVLFACEALGLRRDTLDMLDKAKVPDEHPAYTALQILEKLAEWYELPLDQTPPPSAREPLRRSMTASSGASRRFSSIAEEVSAFSDDESASANAPSEADGRSDSDAFEYDPEQMEPFPKPQARTGSPQNLVGKLALVDTSGDPQESAVGADCAEPSEEPRMTWSDVFSPGRLWHAQNARRSQSQIGRTSSTSSEATPSEASRMTSPTRANDSATLPGGYIPTRTTSDAANPTDYGRNRARFAETDRAESDGFGGIRWAALSTTTARFNDPAPHTPSASVRGTVGTQTPSNNNGPAVLARAQRMAQDALQQRDASQGKSGVGKLATQDVRADDDASLHTASSDDPYNLDLDDTTQAFGSRFPIPSGEDDASREGRASRGARLDTGALRHGNAPASSAPGFGSGGMPDNAVRTAGGFGLSEMPDNARKAAEAAGKSSQSGQRAAAGKAAASFGTSGMPDNQASVSIPARGTSQFNAGAMHDNAQRAATSTAPLQVAKKPSKQDAASSFGEGAMYDNKAKGKAQAPTSTSPQPSNPAQQASTSFGTGPMRDNAANVPATTSGYGIGSMPDNLASPTRTSSSKLAAGGQSQSPSSAGTRTNASFQPGGMPDNATLASSEPRGGFGQGPMPDNAQHNAPTQSRPTFQTTGMVDNAGRFEAARSGASAAPAAARSRAAVGGAAVSNRNSLWSSGGMSLLPGAIHTTRAPQASAPSSTTGRNIPGAMPYEWQTVFDGQPRILATIEQIGADGPLDQVSEALRRADFGAALTASRGAYDTLTQTAGNTSVANRIISDMYRAYLTGPLPEALSHRLREAFVRGDMQSLRPMVDFVQYVNRTVASPYSLDRHWQPLMAYRFWEANWPLLQGYEALSTAISAVGATSLPSNQNAQAAIRRARNAIRTQMLLQGPAQPYQIEQGETASLERTTLNPRPSLYAALDSDLYELGQTGQGSCQIVVTSPTYLRLQADDRDSLERFYRETSYFLELLVQDLAQHGIRENDIVALAAIDRAPSVEVACSGLQAYLNARHLDE